MINLDLTKEEKDVLLVVLEDYVSDLRMEIADTDKMDFREMLKNQKETLKRVLEKLRQVKEDK